MSGRFEVHCAEVRRLFDALMRAPKHAADRLPPDLPRAGIYLFWEQEPGQPTPTPKYVGRSRRLPDRVRNHSKAAATFRQASFAVLIARKETGLSATYRPAGSRKDLVTTDPRFERAFAEAKARIGRMQVQVVSVEDPIQQALLEMYVAVELGTEFNSFETT